MSLEQKELLDAQIRSMELLKASMTKKDLGPSAFNVEVVIKATLEAMKIFDANNTCLTVEQCAEFLDVHRNTISSRLHSGEIKGQFLGRVWRIPKLQFVEEILKRENYEN